MKLSDKCLLHHKRANIQLSRLSKTGGTKVYSILSRTAWCMPAVKALVRLHGCAGMSEPSLLANAICTKIALAAYLSNSLRINK